MNTTNIEKLPISEITSFFLEYKPTIDIQYAKSLIGKLIYFTWTYLTILENDLNNQNDLKDNPLIQDIPINDITNVTEFNNYKFEGWETLPNDYYGNIYKVTNMEDRTIVAIPYDFDGVNVYLMIKENNDGKEEIVRKKYPICLIKEFLEQ